MTDSHSMSNTTPFELSDGKPIIFGVVGAEGAGKDTLANHLVSKYGFVKYSMAQPIKEIARIMFGWSDELLHGRSKDAVDPVTGIKPREFYKWFGTDIAQHDMHTRFPNLVIPPREIWVHSMKAFVAKQIESTKSNTRRTSISSDSPPSTYPVLRAIRNNPTRIVIPDIRFLHEARAIHELGGILINLTTSNPQANQDTIPAQYDIPKLTEPSAGWVHCTLNNPRVSIPDFHTRIDTWLTTMFSKVVASTDTIDDYTVEEANETEYDDDLINTMARLKTPFKEPEHEYTSNLSIYI